MNNQELARLKHELEVRSAKVDGDHMSLRELLYIVRKEQVRRIDTDIENISDQWGRIYASRPD